MFGELFGWLPAGLEAILVWLTSVTGSPGVGIILLTLGIRVALVPLTIKQARSTAAMKDIQPKVDELKKKYKDNPQELNRRVMELYRAEGVNPFSSCLPLLVQFPFLIALFHVLRSTTFGGADPQFLLWDLTLPDRYYILPILSGISLYLQSAMTVTDSSQKAILYIMPAFGAYISINFPSGLVLYWVVGNFFSVGQHYLLTKERQGAQGGGKAK